MTGLIVLDTKTLAPLDVASRLPRLSLSLKANNLDALLVTRLANIRYLSGFTGSAAMMLVTATGSTLFVTDGRYGEQSRDQLAEAGVDAAIAIAMAATAQLDAIAQAIADNETTRLGLEGHGITWDQERQFAARFAVAVSNLEIVSAGTLVEDLRRVKDDGEVARIAAACAIADDAFQALLPKLGTGLTEQQFALQLEFAMRERGASANSFDPIIASGPNGAKPHARPSDRVIERNELVVCDFGCIVDGYCSDMTRTVSVGDPGSDARHLYDVVFEAQAAGRALVKAGAELRSIDGACRSIIDAAGWGELFSHSTGHGVGIEIHEAPRVATTASGSVFVRDVVTVEPGVYLPGVGGVRIEDTLVVGTSGADVLTNTPKELIL